MNRDKFQANKYSLIMLLMCPAISWSATASIADDYQLNPPPPPYVGGYQGGPSPNYQPYPNYPNNPNNPNYSNYAPNYQRGRVTYAPAGLTLPVTLNTSISTQAAQPGDLIQASLSQNVDLGGGNIIPAGSVVSGNLTEAKAGGFLGKSGKLTIKFNRLRTPDGVEVPLTTHIVGEIGKYNQKDGDESGTVRGEGATAKVGQAAIRGAVGAGLGAGLGTAIGAIAGRSGYGAGRGAWSGAAIGGGAGVADSLLLRKGRDVVIKSGTNMQVQLDAPVSISGGGVPPYTGAF